MIAWQALWNEVNIIQAYNFIALLISVVCTKVKWSAVIEPLNFDLTLMTGLFLFLNILTRNIISF